MSHICSIHVYLPEEKEEEEEEEEEGEKGEEEGEGKEVASRDGKSVFGINSIQKKFSTLTLNLKEQPERTEKRRRKRGREREREKERERKREKREGGSHWSKRIHSIVTEHLLYYQCQSSSSSRSALGPVRVTRSFELLATVLKASGNCFMLHVPPPQKSKEWG